jgi:superfamily I DNA/RNA helicase
MSVRIPENVSTWLFDWSIVTIIGNTIPPRDPNDDDDEAEDEDDDAKSDDDFEPAVVRERSGEPRGGSPDDLRYLTLIDKMKAALIEPERAPEALRRFSDAAEIVRTYRLYEDELRRINALDFNSLILEVRRLAVTYPAIAARYRRSHPYWLLDEFQDTNDAQYRFLRALAGDNFKNVFAVADDDQIIYQWNGASFRQIQRFSVDYHAGLVQLTTNHRCPPTIVEAANRLVAYNAQRTEAKKPLVAGKINLRFRRVNNFSFVFSRTKAPKLRVSPRKYLQEERTVGAKPPCWPALGPARPRTSRPEDQACALCCSAAAR